MSKNTKIRKYVHMSFNINGMLRLYEGKSMDGAFSDSQGNPVSDKDAREYLRQCQEKGWKLIPFCHHDECPDFDYFGGGCPGHEETIVEEDEQ